MLISVVIPTLDEAERIADAIRSAAAPGEDALEVVVADAGSRDATVERARAAGARVVESPPGRARQLAAGVAAARGDALLFLHADTALPPGWSAAVRRALGAPGVAGGAFRFAFTREPGQALSPSLAWVELGVALRVALFRLPYGDQAVFATRAALERAGGVPQVPLMEDLDLVRALQRVGRFVLLRERVNTSPRRYQAGGVLRTMLRHWIAALAWSVGVDRARIAAWYAGPRRRAVARAAALSRAGSR